MQVRSIIQENGKWRGERENFLDYKEDTHLLFEMLLVYPLKAFIG